MESSNEAKELRKHLFGQMERLSDPTLDLDKELKRADALAKVGTVIVNSHKQEVDLLKITQPKEKGGAKTIPLKAGEQKDSKQIANG
jgi:hypothetical protein